MRCPPLSSIALLAVTCGSPSPDLESTTDPIDQAPDPVPFPEGEPIELDELCDAVTSRLCLALVECWDWPYENVEHCLQDQTCFGFAEFEAAVQAGEIDYDPQAVGDCAAFFDAAPCNFLVALDVPDVARMLSGCPHASEWGRRAAGESCTTVLSCDGDSHCDRSATCPGTCTPFAELGEPCEQTGELPRCRPPHRCTDGSCEAGSSSGRPCETDDDCIGSYCSFYYEPVPYGMCDDGPAWGDPCDEGECAIGLRCDPTTLVCGAPGELGETCFNISFPCADPLECESLDYAGPGVCVPLGSEGEPCVSHYDRCEPQLFCDGTSTCVSPGEAGDGCDDDDECQIGLECEGGLCTHRAYLGDPCDPEDPCTLALCDDGTCVPHHPLGDACESDDECVGNTCLDLVCADPGAC